MSEGRKRTMECIAIDHLGEGRIVLLQNYAFLYLRDYEICLPQIRKSPVDNRKLAILCGWLLPMLIDDKFTVERR